MGEVIGSSGCYQWVGPVGVVTSVSNVRYIEIVSRRMRADAVKFSFD